MANTECLSTEEITGLDVFRGLSSEALTRLLRAGTPCHLEPRERLSCGTAGPLTHYYFLLRGVLAIAVTPSGSKSPDPIGASKRPPKDQWYLGFFEVGACFSDAYLRQSAQVEQAPTLACVAVNAVSLLQVEAAHLEGTLQSEPLWRERLAEVVVCQRERFLALQDPSRRLVQDFFLRENYVTSSVVRVGRLDRCLDCNKCHDACEARYGKARMARVGLRLGRLTFPIACRNCHDQSCISVCSFGGIAADASSGDVRISDRCVGCGACAAQCPNDAIRMIWRPYTAADFPDPMPLSDASGMTNVDKLMVAGDVSGAALIRLAINEAVRAIDRIQPTGALRGSEGFDVVIVGSGPAGLAAALRCQERQLTYCVLERDRLASTIRSYPKGKHVMAEPSNIELNGALWFQDCSKEELLERWQETARAQRLQIREQTEVRRIERIDGRFVIEAQNGRLVAENVLICIGKRGAPRRLGVPGESHPRVRYLLEDPDDYRGKRVMVVGGGDSALEAALALADVAGTFVTLSYRRAAFARAKVQNRRRLEAQEAAGRIHVELNSTVAAVMPHVVRLTTARGEIDVPNDFVLALLGADPPTEFLQSAGIRVLQPGSQEMMEFAAGRGERQQAVKCDRCAGYAERACLEACPTGALIEVETDRLFLETEADSLTGIRRFSEAPFLFGVPGEQARWKVWVTLITLLSLTAIGIECFLIRTQPEISLLGQYVRVTRAHFDVSYTSGRGIGHWLGYVGAGMMLASFFYSPRTRIRRFQHWGSQTGWFSAHIWLGFAGAMLVTYHSALKLDRWASIACVLMWLTVLTGAVGRYLFGRIRSEAGLAEFELEVLRGRLLAPAQGASDTGAVSAQWAAHRRINYYRVLDMLLRHWKMAHIVLAIAMAILAAIHIVYGFRYKAV